MSPQAKREVVAAIWRKDNISERCACRLVGLSRSMLRYEAQTVRGNEMLKARLVELAHVRQPFGYLRPHVLLESKGMQYGRKSEKLKHQIKQSEKSPEHLPAGAAATVTESKVAPMSSGPKQHKERERRVHQLAASDHQQCCGAIQLLSQGGPLVLRTILYAVSQGHRAMRLVLVSDRFRAKGRCNKCLHLNDDSLLSSTSQHVIGCPSRGGDFVIVLCGAKPLRLLLVEYDEFVRFPSKTMAAIYGFIDEPLFDHDFNNIEFDAAEFDERLGLPGLHAVGRQIRAIERQTILPPDLFLRFENDAFWRDNGGNSRNVRVI